MTYGSGVGLDIDILTPNGYTRLRLKRKNYCQLKTFFQCFAKGHKTARVEKCQYNGIKNEGKLNDAINAYLKGIYQSRYSKYCQYHNPYLTPFFSKIREPKFCLNGFTSMYFYFLWVNFFGESDFRFPVFFLSVSLFTNFSYSLLRHNGYLFFVWKWKDEVGNNYDNYFIW